MTSIPASRSGARDDFRASVVTVEAGLGDDDADLADGGVSHGALRAGAGAVPRTGASYLS